MWEAGSCVGEVENLRLGGGAEGGHGGGMEEGPRMVGWWDGGMDLRPGVHIQYCMSISGWCGLILYCTAYPP